ncbi:MAG: RNA polymerase sigma factor [Acidobacteriia bacterium]|nr:RNA polymerase sigma factor [Terriglobia bacterium]
MLRILIDKHNATPLDSLAAFAESIPAAVEKPEPSLPMDEAAFSAFYKETAPKLWSYIRRTSGDAALADDLLQESFYRFLRADLPPMDHSHSRAYLYRIAGSLISDHWREQKRQRRWSLLRNFRGEAQTKPETFREEMEMFAQLKSQEQSLLWLAYVEGFDHREIATALHLKEKSVRVLLFRARKKLAALLGNQNTVPGEGI